MVPLPFHPLIPRPVNSVRGRNHTMYWMLIHRLYSLLENLTPALQGITTLLALSLSLQKVISSFRQTSCFIMVGNMLRMCVCVCVCVCVCARACTRSCAFRHVRLLETPWTVTPQAPLSMEFSRQEYWDRLPFPTPGDLPNSGIDPASLTPAGRFFTNCPLEKPLC